MDDSKPYKFICFGAMDVTKPYELIEPWMSRLRFGAIDVTKPYKFIRFVAMDATKSYQLIGPRMSPKPINLYALGPWMPPNPIN